jgi:CheY-like chemotaxis protein
LPKILVADDNSNIQKMVTLAFKGEGIDVVTVGNGEAAVKKTIEIVPDLVLADIFMPVRSGYEVCDFLKQDRRFSHIPVVLLAGAFDPFDEREAQRVGADGVLKKPFVPPDPLIALVKELLAKNGERLVAVAIPAQTAAVAAQNSAQAPEAAVSSAPAFTPPPFVPSPVAPSTLETSVKENESPDDDIEIATTAPPMRDFSIPVTPPESEHGGGADAFGSMLETSPLDSITPLIHNHDESETEKEAGEDRKTDAASPFSAFEGFTAWRASASSAEIVEEEEAATTENQFMPSSKDLMGRVWEMAPELLEKSPDETVVEPLDEISPLTHSAQRITAVRGESSDLAQPSAPVESKDVAETEHAKSPGGSDWRSAFAQFPGQHEQIVDSPAPSMSPWRISTPPAETVQNDGAEPVTAEIVGNGAVEPGAETASVDTPSPFAEDEAQTDSRTTGEAEPAFANAESVFAPSMETAEPMATEAQAETFIVGQHMEAIDESASPAAAGNVGTRDWAATLPEHSRLEDTTEIARSVIERLAPSAVESVATSFPVPTEAHTDSRVVEDIVARVVERMQPQILEIITYEVLRPVVEALVRRQLEQKLPE